MFSPCGWKPKIKTNYENQFFPETFICLSWIHLKWHPLAEDAAGPAPPKVRRLRRPPTIFTSWALTRSELAPPRAPSFEHRRSHRTVQRTQPPTNRGQAQAVLAPVVRHHPQPRWPRRQPKWTRTTPILDNCQGQTRSRCSAN